MARAEIGIPQRIPNVDVVGGVKASSSARQRLVKRLSVIAPVALIVVGAAVFGYQKFAVASTPTVVPTTVAVSRGTITSTVSSTGTVAALNQAKLAFGSTGIVSEVKVRVGEAVTKGQELARIDTTELTLQVAQQKATLASAEAKLANMKVGSSAEDLKASQLALEAAKSKLAAMDSGGRAEDVVTAQASLASARAKLDQLRSPSAADVRSAEQSVASATSGLQTAQNTLDTLKIGATAEEIKAAEFAVDQAKNSLWSQQLSRDGTCGNNKDSFQCRSADAGLASAETGVLKAQNDLAKLKVPATAEEITAAEKAVASAQAQLEVANLKLAQLKSPTASDVTAAQATVTQAEQALVMKQKPYTESDLQAQRQAVAAAEAALVAKQIPYTDADLVAAQASVDQAKVQVALAQRNLDNATLVAPFDGVVGAVGFNVGESSGSATITLVDPKNVRLDVTVDESDIAKVEAGQKATITFGSISGKTFAGKVTGVAPSATITSGVATYSVSISIDQPTGIRAGMTGNATIVYGEQANVLVVPLRAVKTSGKTKVVEVLAAGQKTTREVKVGISNEQSTEITEGLAEGDQVVISTTTSTQRTGNAAMVMGGAAGGPPPGQ